MHTSSTIGKLRERIMEGATARTDILFHILAATSPDQTRQFQIWIPRDQNGKVPIVE